MRVEKQGRDECILATIAALADTPLSRVRTRACELAGTRHWRPYTKDRFWGVVATVADELGVTGMVPTVMVYGWELRPAGRPRAKLQGKGSVLVVYALTRAHIMPYEDGLIYDTDGSAPITLKQCLERDKGIVYYKVYGGPRYRKQPKGD